MAFTVADYKNFTLSAGAFQVPLLEGFLCWVHVVRSGPSADELIGKLFTPRSEWGNPLFDTEQQAIEAGLAFGRKLVDGEIAGLTFKDL